MAERRPGLRSRARRGLGRLADRLLGRPEPPLLDQLARRDERHRTFDRALDLVNFERVEGDIVELGVFTGKSLALLARSHSFDPKGMERRLVGFDSFTGLAGGEGHPRWSAGDCAESHGWHPLLEPGDPVTPEVPRRLFEACGLAPPEIVVGDFADTLPAAFPEHIPRVAVLHVDCDLYESTRLALDAVEPALQDGTVVLFDDWFHHRGRPDRGEARAFAEFLDAHPRWSAVPYRPYAVFCHSFLLHRDVPRDQRADPPDGRASGLPGDRPGAGRRRP